MHYSRFAARLLFAAVLLGSVCSADDTAQKEVSDLLAKAASLQDVRAQGAKPFRLHLQIHAQRITIKPADGEYDEIWLSPDKWRREISFPGFAQVEVGDKDSKWVTRNVGFRPSVAYAISRALDNLARKELWPDEEVRAVRTQKKKDAFLRCAELQTVSRRRTLCFDASGTLSREETETDRFEYSDYGPTGSRLFPRRIQIYQSGLEVSDIRAEEQRLPSSLSSELFSHDPGALQMALCERSAQEAPARKVPPVYPESARRSRQQGTVTLYAMISAEGRVEKVRVVQSVSPALDQATIDAVQQWVYAPARCGSLSLPSEREISVNYSLSPY